MTLLLGLLACLDPSAPIDASDEVEIVLEVPKGTNATRLGVLLTEHKLLDSGLGWKIYVKQHPETVTCLKAGRFAVRRSMSLSEVLTTLCGTPIANDVPFTVVEGWRIRDIDKALAAKGYIQAGAYAKVTLGKAVPAPFEISSPSYEGYLWPETYMVSPDHFDVDRFVVRQLNTFKEKFLDTHALDGGRSLHELVVVASMLEREEPKPRNRPLVAGIMYRRLDNNTPLGIDATSHYELENWNDRKGLLKSLRDPNDPYNSRLRKGLPPTAIGNPTLPSLEAAMKPKASPYWYYLHDSKGEIHPARNAAEHEANRKRYNVY